MAAKSITNRLIICLNLDATVAAPSEGFEIIMKDLFGKVINEGSDVIILA